MEHALNCIVLLAPGGPGRVAVECGIPFLWEGDPVKSGEESIEEIGLGCGEWVVSGSEGEGAYVVASAQRAALVFCEVGGP